MTTITTEKSLYGLVKWIVEAIAAFIEGVAGLIAGVWNYIIHFDLTPVIAGLEFIMPWVAGVLGVVGVVVILYEVGQGAVRAFRALRHPAELVGQFKVWSKQHPFALGAVMALYLILAILLVINSYGA